jgi:6-phosphogluconolactonase
MSRSRVSSLAISTLLLAGFIGWSSVYPAKARTAEDKAEDKQDDRQSGEHHERPDSLYASVGATLTQYEIDTTNAELLARGSLTFPYSIQYAWPHPSHKILYVAWARRSGVDGPIGDQGVTAVRIERSGALGPMVGQPLLLRKRPVHLSTDVPGEYLLVAHNNPPAGVTVYRLEPDGSIGNEIPQPGVVDGGIYAHQVRVDPTNKMAILVTRGNVPAEAPSHVEEPGALKVFHYDDGVLSDEVSIAPNGGFGFKPRHVDFFKHRFVFLSVERQNQLQVYERREEDELAALPKFTKTTLADPAHHNEKLFPAQMVGPIHISRDHKFVYLGNRNGGVGGFATDGENNVAVFSIDRETGEPTLIQNADTHGFVPRTLTFDEDGKILIASNQSAVNVKDSSGNVTTVPTSLAVFRIRHDGRLEYVRKYDDAGGTWAGTTTAP